MNESNQLQVFVARRIKYLRKEKNLSQEKLSEIAGLGVKYVHNIENNKYNLRIDTLEKIINALDTTPENFFNFRFPENSDTVEELNLYISKLPKQMQNEIVPSLKTLLKNYLK